MIYCFYGDQADHAHEERMLQSLLSQLQLDWDAPNQWIYIVYNAMWNGQDIDFVCFTPFSIIVGDFKSYSGKLNASENGSWKLSNQNNEALEVKGGNQFNPYRQLRNNKFALLNFLNNESSFSHCNLGHIGAVTVFKNLIEVTDSFSEKTKKWMGITDIAHSSGYFSYKKSTGIRLEEHTVAELIKKMNLIPYQWQAKPPIAVSEHDYLSPPISTQTASPKGTIKNQSIHSNPLEVKTKPKHSIWGWLILVFGLVMFMPNIMKTISQVFGNLMTDKVETSHSEDIKKPTVEDAQGVSESENLADLNKSELKWSEEEPVSQISKPNGVRAEQPKPIVEEKSASSSVKSTISVDKHQANQVVTTQPVQTREHVEKNINAVPKTIPAKVENSIEPQRELQQMEEKIQHADDIDSRLRDSGY